MKHHHLITNCYYSHYFAFFIFIYFFSHSIHGQDTTIFKLKTGDLNIGIDARLLYRYDSSVQTEYKTITEGLSFRYQSSVLLHQIKSRQTKKFRAGDLLSAEIATGLMQTRDPVQRNNVWFSYRFEMGFSFIYHTSKNIDLNLNLILLRFARDYITQNMSGSATDVRIRVKRIIAEAGLASRQLRIIGTPVPFFNKDEEANMAMFGLRYLVNTHKNLGIRLEFLSNNTSKNKDGIYNLRFYYGNFF